MTTNLRLEKEILRSLNSRAIGQNLCGMRRSTLVSELDIRGIAADEHEIRDVMGKLIDLGQITVKEISPGSEYYYITPKGLGRATEEGWL